MSQERSGAGDPAVTLALLWGEPPASASAPRKGPRRRRDTREIVDAAIAIADADGLPALTMRRLAGALDVAPMTLYTHVPTKEVLLDLMLDAVYLRMPRRPFGRRGWRRRLQEVADANRALLREHPWAATLGVTRPPLGPGVMAKYEHELTALQGLGLDDVEMDAALTFLLGFVAAAVRAEQQAAAVAASGADDAAWWAANAPLLERVMDPARYPLAARVGAAAGAAHGSAADPDAGYAFGLARVLDGLGVLVAERAGARR